MKELQKYTNKTVKLISSSCNVVIILVGTLVQESPHHGVITFAFQDDWVFIYIFKNYLFDRECAYAYVRGRRRTESAWSAEPAVGLDLKILRSDLSRSQESAAQSAAPPRRPDDWVFIKL